MWVLVFSHFGTIYDGPFDNYSQAGIALWSYVGECGCGCKRIEFPLQIGTI